MSLPGADGRELTFGDAIREALAEELRRDPRVFLLGEDVAEAGTTFKVLDGLVEEFGPERILDTPISEPGFTGLAVGAAMTGMRPIVDMVISSSRRFQTSGRIYLEIARGEGCDYAGFGDGAGNGYAR